MKEKTMIEIDGKRYRPVKADEVKSGIAYVLVEEEEKFPKDGDLYWFLSNLYMTSYRWWGDDVDRKLAKNVNLYKTEREVKDELRARRLILAVNNRRRELNAESDANGMYRIYNSCPENTIHVSYLGDVIPTWNYALVHPFGIFRSEEIAEKVIDEFKDELIWYFVEYLPFIHTEGDYIREVE